MTMTNTTANKQTGMNKYEMKFTGRMKGAIGIFYPIVEIVEADCPDNAWHKLYDKYEHVQGLETRAI